MIERNAYIAALHDADPRAATAVMHAALNGGTTPAQWIRDVIVPVQRAVGERWFDGSWSIADEHAATAVAEQTVTLLQPFEKFGADALQVLFACAEGEWHSFPARLAAELACTAGVGVTVLGAGVPAGELSRRLVTTRPDVLALSCTMPTNLIGAWRSIQAAHALEIPVAVGGRAWSVDGRRACALGADVQLAEAAELATTAFDGIVDDTDIATEALLLEVPDQALLLLALERHAAASTWMQQMSESRRQAALEDLGCLARHAAAAVAVDDPTVVGDLLDWLVALLSPRGVPVVAVLDSCFYLADAVEPDAPLAARVLRSQSEEANVRHGD